MKDLKLVLNECKKSAKIGYKIAVNNEKSLSRALSDAEEKIRAALLEFSSSSCYSPTATELLETQRSEIKQSFNDLSVAFKEKLENLHYNMSKFSVTLFGRTMAGKSTLMEILTEGDGNTIGKGAQRTTRDVRKYTWNGLEVTDVPGIGAFEGEEDEQIAYTAAETADLILFLITDDAPQASEAECFSRIINMGKPVICIVNVKASVSEGKSLKLFQRDLQKKFDTKRLNTIRDQFLKYADQYGQSWRHIPFVYVHLKSAFLSHQNTDTELSALYYQLSRIDYLKNKIIEQVETRGKFYRIKNFIDIIATPILKSMDDLLSQSHVNSAQGRIIVDKRKQLESWKQQFHRDGINQIRSLFVKIQSELNTEIAAFAEEHFSDKNADKAWKEVLEDRRIELRCQELLSELNDKANDKLKEVSREITNELEFTSFFADDKNIKMTKIIDGKRIWNWSYAIVSGGLTIASIVACFVGAAVTGPLGLAAFAVTAAGVFGSFLFKNRDKKEDEARARLENDLKENVAKMCSSLQDQMENNLNTLVSVRIDGLLRDMNNINTVIFKLADTQRELTWGLNKHLLEMNNQLVTEGIIMIGAEGLQYHIQAVARIPGNTSLIMLRDGDVFPQEQKEALHKLMGERIHFVYETDNKKVLISRILGKEIDRRSIRMEQKVGIAHVPIIRETPELISNIRLAQQFSEIHIIKS